MKKLVLLLMLVLCVLENYAQNNDKIEYIHLNDSDFYEGCANKLLIKGGKNLSIGCDNASYVLGEGNDKGLIVLIVPNHNVGSVSVTVSEDGFFRDVKYFNVKEVPPARIIWIINNKEIDTMQGVPFKNISKIAHKIIPDVDFAKKFPKEIKYRIDNIKYTLKRNNEIFLASENITEISQKAKKGDELEIIVEKVKRENFRWSVLPAKVSNPVINIPIL